MLLICTLLSLYFVRPVVSYEASMRRNLQVTTQTIDGYTYTCDMTNKAFAFGGS